MGERAQKTGDRGKLCRLVRPGWRSSLGGCILARLRDRLQKYVRVVDHQIPLGVDLSSSAKMDLTDI